MSTPFKLATAGVLALAAVIAANAAPASVAAPPWSRPRRVVKSVLAMLVAPWSAPPPGAPSG